MEYAAFLGIVVNPFCLFVSQRIARTIGGSGNDAFDLRSSFDGVMKMENRHSLPLPEAGLSHWKCISVLSLGGMLLHLGLDEIYKRCVGKVDLFPPALCPLSPFAFEVINIKRWCDLFSHFVGSCFQQ